MAKKRSRKGSITTTLDFDQGKYDEFLVAIKKIADLVSKKIPNKINLENVFLSGDLVGPNLSEEYRSKPEEFTKENIISEFLDFLGYDKGSRVSESELKKSFGTRWPDYKLIVNSDYYLLVEAEPLNTDLYATGKGVKQAIEWIANKAVDTDLGIATDGLRWVLLEYSVGYRKHREIKKIDLSPFLQEELGFKTENFTETEKKRCFIEFVSYFSKELVETTLQKKNVEVESYQEDISNRFYKEYMKLVFGFRANSTCLVNSITGVTDLSSQKRIAQTVINRLIFIKFIEARGWLKGDKKFLSNLWTNYTEAKATAFYDSYLKILFFKVLNEPDEAQKKGNFAGIKYLNGGLFNKTKEEEASPDYSVKDDILIKIIKFLEGYRFEGEALTKLEIGNGKKEDIMSPEILGYIFERTANHESGAYYTPDNVTSFIAEGTVNQYTLQIINSRLKELSIHPIKNIKSLFVDDEVSKDELRNLYEKIKNVKVLDPACGSGAFFMPVISLLMEAHNLFTGALNLPSEPYKIKKWIIENNIFGVELNREATEIAKLRLWLDLVSTVENINEIDLLPNIEYNILSGNSLLGFDEEIKSNGINKYYPLKSIDPYIEILSSNYPAEAQRIRELSEKPDISNTLKIRDILLKLYRAETIPSTARMVKKTIEVINEKLKDNLNIHYSGYLKDKFDIDLIPGDMEKHTPIHWMLDFHEVVGRGGFDIVLGNPPYIEITSKIVYPLEQFSTRSCGNTYAPFFERAIKLTKEDGYFGYIVPISSICTDRMAPLQNLLIEGTSKLKISNYDDRPDKIFKGLEDCRSSIIFGCKGPKKTHEVLSTHYHRWYAEERDKLFKNMKYLNVTDLVSPGIIPKLGENIESSVLLKIRNSNKLSSFLTKESEAFIVYHNAPRYWIRAMDFMPEFKNGRGAKVSPHNKVIYVKDGTEAREQIIAVINSSLFYWFFVISGNGRDLTAREIENFPFNPDSVKPALAKKLKILSSKLMQDYKAKSKLKDTTYKATGNVVYQEFYPKLSKKIIDEIDDVIAEHYGFTKEEKEYIENFDIRFRMGS